MHAIKISQVGTLGTSPNFRFPFLKRFFTYLASISFPERKGKRNIQMAPFIITSTGFKKKAEEKEQHKRELEEQKEIKKKQKLERQREKENKTKNEKFNINRVTKFKENKAPDTFFCSSTSSIWERHVRNIFNSSIKTIPLVTNINVEKGLLHLCQKY